MLSVDELKQHKSYVKVLKKHSSELKELRKKHQKKVSSANKDQKSRNSKLQSDTQRRRSQMEKHLKRSIKKNEPFDPIQQELSALDQQMAQQTLQLKEWQMHELLKLRKEQHAVERKRQEAQLLEAFQKLKETAKECQAAQLKKLKETCEKEKKELQKMLDRKRQNSISEARSRDKDKAEAELNEINKKHIHDSVALIRRLEEAQTRRQDKLTLRQREILQHIDEELPLLQTQLQRDLDEEYRRLPEEICRWLQSELNHKSKEGLLSGLSNHSSPSSGSGPPSNCSTPSSTPTRRSWSRSTDNCSNSSTPVLSEAEMSLSWEQTVSGASLDPLHRLLDSRTTLFYGHTRAAQNENKK